jgi:hypothetical protein
MNKRFFALKNSKALRGNQKQSPTMTATGDNNASSRLRVKLKLGAQFQSRVIKPRFNGVFGTAHDLRDFTE